LKRAIDFVSRAIREKDYAIETQVFFGESEDHSVLYHNRGMFYLQKGFYQEALADLTKAIELNPNVADVYFYRGNIQLLLEEYSKALEDYHQAIVLSPNNSEYYRQRALAYTIMGSIDKAKLDLEIAEIEKNKLETLQNELGLDEFSKNSFQKAIDHFSQFIELNSHSAIGYQNRGSALYQAGKLEEALSDYNEAICLDPAQAEVYQMRALAFITLPAKTQEEESAHLMEAQTNLLTALEINPSDAKIYQNLAACYFLRNDLEAAIDCYEQALKIAPIQDHSLLFKKLSFIHCERGEYEKALLSCEKAIQLGSKDREIYVIQGRCFFETNQFEQAIQNYHLAIDAGCDDVNIYFNRAKAYFCLHQNEKALEDATRVLKADPVNAECYKLVSV
jgi:tetratricopeptide (TPR) repeat protein